MMRNTSVIGSIFAAAAMTLGIGAAYAGPGPHCSDAQAQTMGRDGFGTTPSQFRQLNLSQQQRNEIFHIKYKSLPVLHQLYQQMRQTRIALREATVNAKYDAEKLRKLTTRLGLLQAEIVNRRTNDQHSIFAALNPQQQTQLKQMREWRTGKDSQRGPDRGFYPGTPSDMDS